MKHTKRCSFTTHITATSNTFSSAITYYGVMQVFIIHSFATHLKVYVWKRISLFGNKNRWEN